MIVKRSFDSPCCITFKSAFKHLHMSGSNADLVSLARHFARKYRFPFVPGRSHSQLYRIGTQTNSKFAARVSQAKATPFAPCFRENSRVYKIMIVNFRNERNRFSKKIEKKRIRRIPLSYCKSRMQNNIKEMKYLVVTIILPFFVKISHYCRLISFQMKLVRDLSSFKQLSRSNEKKISVLV